MAGRVITRRILRRVKTGGGSLKAIKRKNIFPIEQRFKKGGDCKENDRGGMTPARLIRRSLTGGRSLSHIKGKRKKYKLYKRDAKKLLSCFGKEEKKLGGGLAGEAVETSRTI